MTTIETTAGSRKVITFESLGVYHSRLYVNNGETATLIAAKHSTEKGARRWASRTLFAPQNRQAVLVQS